MYRDGFLLLSNSGRLLVYDADLYSQPPSGCCCPADGCCSGIIQEGMGQTFTIEVIDATNGCITVGSTAILSEAHDGGGTGIWSSDVPLDPYCVRQCRLSCAQLVDGTQQFQLAWFTGLNSTIFCPDEANTDTELVSITCDPFEAIFLTTLNQILPNECPCCYDNFTGTFTVRITLNP